MVIECNDKGRCITFKVGLYRNFRKFCGTTCACHIYLELVINLGTCTGITSSDILACPLFACLRTFCELHVLYNLE
jgi:hypothetical protein